LSENRYVIRPNADQDLDDQAVYYATEANPEHGHRFLVSAHETFSLLSTQPDMGWNPKLRLPELRGLRLFRVTGFKNILILYRPLENGVETLRVVHGSQNVRRLLRRQGIE
jgi:toxin ParE1/3/4